MVLDDALGLMHAFGDTPGLVQSIGDSLELVHGFEDTPGLVHSVGDSLELVHGFGDTPGHRLTGIGGVGGGAVEEAGGAGHPQASHGAAAVAIDASGTAVAALLRRGAGHVAPWRDAARVSGVACGREGPGVAQGRQGPPPAGRHSPRPTLLGALWRVADVDGQLAAEGVHPHHAGGAVGAGQRGELAGVAGDAVQCLGDVCRSLQDDVLGWGGGHTWGRCHPMACGAWSDPSMGQQWGRGGLRPPQLMSPPRAPAALSVPGVQDGLCRAAMGQGDRDPPARDAGREGRGNKGSFGGASPAA